MPIEVTTLSLQLHVPATIRFADMGVSFDLESRMITFDAEIMRKVLEASGMGDGQQLPREITDAIISLWYRQARAQGQPEDPHMERFLFNQAVLDEEPAAHTLH